MRERFFVAFNYACMAGNLLPRQKTALNSLQHDRSNPPGVFSTSSSFASTPLPQSGGSKKGICFGRPSLLQRFATADEVAAMVAYACSTLAGATNGAALRVDGGVVRGTN